MNPRSALVADRAAAVAETPADGLTAVVVPKIPVSPERLAARQVIDQAKMLLITEYAMAEPDAYRWIQKTAMDRRSPMAAIAAGVIDGSQRPTSPSESSANAENAENPENPGKSSSDPLHPVAATG